MTIQPLNSHVLLRPAERRETLTASGLVLPDSDREPSSEGVIEALPPDGSDEVMVGDRVLYRPMAGDEITVRGETRRLVPVGDLLAKFVEADAIPS